jgi:hypothetical protein
MYSALVWRIKIFRGVVSSCVVPVLACDATLKSAQDSERKATHSFVIA